MAVQWVRVLFLILIISFSMILNGCLYSPSPYYNAAIHTPGSIWKSSSPEIWFIVNEDGSETGEYNYNGKILKIDIGTVGGALGILISNDDGNKEFERIKHDKGGSLISTSIQSCSKTNLVLKVIRSNLPDFHDTQIIFTRSQ